MKEENNINRGYKWKHFIAKGSFAKVYLVSKDKKKYIIKKIQIKNPNSISYTNREIKAGIKTSHFSGVAKFYEFWKDEHYFYLVFEYIAGKTLLDFIIRDNHQFTIEPLSEIQIFPIIKQLVSTVRELHKLGIYHRDLKVFSF